MCNKWIEWHEKGLDKRPRNKDGVAKGADGPGGARRAGEQQRQQQQRANEVWAVEMERSVSGNMGEGERKSSASEVRTMNASSRQGSNAGPGSRKNSAAKIETLEEMTGSGLGSWKNSNTVSRKNSATSIDIAKELIKRTPSGASNMRRGSAASIKPPSSTRSSRGTKRNYNETNDESDDNDDEETLQGQADRQLLHETVEKEDKDGEFKVRTPRNEILPSTPTRRSLRGKSLVDGS